LKTGAVLVEKQIRIELEFLNLSDKNAKMLTAGFGVVVLPHINSETPEEIPVVD
jgi:hypothetical protein